MKEVSSDKRKTENKEIVDTKEEEVKTDDNTGVSKSKETEMVRRATEKSAIDKVGDSENRERDDMTANSVNRERGDVTADSENRKRGDKTGDSENRERNYMTAHTL